VLPVLASTVTFQGAFEAGMLVSLVLWATLLFFSITRGLFPARLFKAALILWAAALAQIGYEVLEIFPLWAVSLLILIPGDFYTSIFNKERLKDGCLDGIFFWILLCFLGLSQEILRGQLHMMAFDLPVGALFVLAMAACVWQNLPGEKQWS